MLKTILQFLHSILKLGRTQPQSYDTPMLGDTIYQHQSDFIERRIKYSHDLIPQLQHEHVELVELYNEISDLIEKQGYLEITSCLDKLKTKYNLHTMHENLYFYCYLEQFFQAQSEQFEVIRAYRKEMNVASNVMVRFIKKWHPQQISDHNIIEFTQEYKALGLVLAQHIDHEENHLYPLYLP